MVLLSVGVVSASDNLTDDAVCLEDTDTLGETTGSYSELQEIIDSSSDGIINLNKSYGYDEAKDRAYREGIEINKNVTINGNGFIIRGGEGLDSGGRLFHISDAGRVTINNLTLRNAGFGGDGSTIYSKDSDLVISNVSIIANKASEGGAIFSTGNLTILNSYFDFNEGMDGGAIFSTGNLTILDSIFTGNSAHHYGGVIFSSGAIANIKNVTFDGNYVPYEGGGGVICSNGTNFKIESSTFKSNSGGSIRGDGVGGAIWINGGNFDIFNVTFMYNTAQGNGGTIMANECNLKITNSTFIGTKLKYFFNGGAIYSDGATNLTIDLVKFENCSAVKGSAIFIDGNSNAYIKDTEFIKNRAFSSAIEIELSENKTYDNNITLGLRFKGQDNIANAIWNNVDLSNIHLQNITCEFSKDGKSRTVKSFNTEGYASPTLGFENDSLMWQDVYENAQLIDVLITNQITGEVILNITSGINNTQPRLNKQLQNDDNLILTDTNGFIEINVENIKQGSYKVKAKHVADGYYADIENTTTFTILGLNVTKDTQDTLVNARDNVTYNITITNEGWENISNVVVNDTFPEGFELLDYSKNWKREGNVFSYIANNGVLNPFESIYLTLVFNATKEGTFNNTITVTNNKTLPVTAVSTNTKVDPFVVLKVVKTSNATGHLLIEDTVNFTITVTNKVSSNVTDINITDLLDDSFEIIAVGNETTYQDAHKIVWNIASLAKRSTASVWVSVKVKTNGTYNNTAIVKSAQSDEIHAVTNITVDHKVILTINESITPENPYVDDIVKFTIFVSNNGPSNATKVFITGHFYDLPIDEIGNRSIAQLRYKSVQWLIPNLAIGESTSVWACCDVKNTGKTLTSAWVNCDENTTKVNCNIEFVVQPNVDLRINKTVDKTDITVGDDVMYTIVVYNNDWITATNVNVTDTLIGNVEIIDISPSIGEYENGIWYVGTLDAWSKANLTMTVKALGMGKIENSVSVNSTEKDKHPSYNRYSCENVTVSKIPTEISVDPLSLDLVVGDERSISATLTPSDAGNVTFTSSDDSIVTVDAEGKVVAVGEGNATVTVSFAGDEMYSPSETEVSVSVKENTSVIINAPELTKYYGGSERFVVNVTDYQGNPLANKTVVIDINGKNYTRTTDANGTASMAIGLPSNTYNVTVTVDNQTINSVITVLSTVNGTDVVKMYRNATQYYATFRDSEGNYLADGTTVKFNINGVMYERKVSGGKGQAKLNINLPAGEYVITAMNPETGENEANNITVLATIVENRDITKFYKNATQYTVKVLGADGKAVGAGENVTFNVNGIFYTRQTNAAGIATLNINLPPADYVITAEYKGYKVANNITVLPVLTAEDITMNYDDGTQFIANLVDGQGKPYAEQKVAFNVNGQLYNKTTDRAGQAKLDIHLPAGQYIITSSYNGANIANKITIRG